jgi:hypothetical protein
MHVAGFILCAFLLISHLVLPAKVTKRAYINIILLVGILILELGFIIPLARQPPQCFDPVTPNGMHSNVTCAFSGAFAAFGGMTLVCWVLVRALFMHLQICWNIYITRTYYIAANVIVWTVTIALTSAVLALVGVSFRFGGYCHVNVGSFSTYWGWLLAFTGLSLLLQLGTFAHCTKVYLSAAFSGRQQLTSGSHKTTSIAGTTTSRNALIAARRLRSILLLQWRSLLIVTVAIFTTAWISIIFIYFDNKITVQAFANTDALIPWILCIIGTQDPNQCTHLTGPIIISENLALATLYILALVGVEAFILLFRLEMMVAWVDLLKKPFNRRGKRDSGIQPESENIGRKASKGAGHNETDTGEHKQHEVIEHNPTKIFGHKQNDVMEDEPREPISYEQREKVGVAV